MGVAMGMGVKKAMLREKGVGMGVVMGLGVVMGVAEACNETRDTRRGIARKDAEKREIANAPG